MSVPIIAGNAIGVSFTLYIIMKIRHGQYGASMISFVKGERGIPLTFRIKGLSITCVSTRK